MDIVADPKRVFATLQFGGEQRVELERWPESSALLANKSDLRTTNGLYESR